MSFSSFRSINRSVSSSSRRLSLSKRSLPPQSAVGASSVFASVGGLNRFDVNYQVSSFAPVGSIFSAKVTSRSFGSKASADKHPVASSTSFPFSTVTELQEKFCELYKVRFCVFLLYLFCMFALNFISYFSIKSFFVNIYNPSYMYI